jgi:hypothetical protein
MYLPGMSRDPIHQHKLALKYTHLDALLDWELTFNSRNLLDFGHGLCHGHSNTRQCLTRLLKCLLE